MPTLTAILRLVIFVLAGSVLIAQSNPVSTPLGAIPKNYADGFAYFSPAGQHVALVKNQGSRVVVSYDGVDGEVFDEIKQIRQVNPPSPTDRGQVVFSADGAHHAYVGRRGEELFVVVDRTARRYAIADNTRPYQDTPSTTINFTFSPSGQRHAYAVSVADPVDPQCKGTACNIAQLTQVVIDGAAQPSFRGQTLSRDSQREAGIVFSPDSKRVAYFRQQGSNNYSVVIDGKEEPQGEAQGFRFSADSRRYMYVARPRRSGAQAAGAQSPFLVVDGKVETLPLEQQLKAQFSPDGSRYAYITWNESPRTTEMRLVVDGQPGQPYMAVDEFQFSNDGKRVAYTARITNTRAVLVVDGQVGAEFARASKPIFTADGSKVLAEVMANGRTFVMVNGVESEPYSSVRELTTSQTGGHYAFIGRATDSGGHSLVVDGKVVGTGNDIKPFTFSPDGSRHAYQRVLRESCVVIDGNTRAAGLGRVHTNPEAFYFSPDGKHVAFVSYPRNVPHSLVLDDASGAQGQAVQMVLFSADSRHFAFAASPGQKQAAVILNGKIVGTFDELFPSTPSSWGFREDGTLQVIGRRANEFVRDTYRPEGTLADFAKNIGATAAPSLTQANPATSPKDPQQTVESAKQAISRGIGGLLRRPTQPAAPPAPPPAAVNSANVCAS